MADHPNDCSHPPSQWKEGSDWVRELSLKSFIHLKNAFLNPHHVKKEKKTALIIDVAVPNDYGINRAEREKITKYQDLKNDLKQTWSLKEISINSCSRGNRIDKKTPKTYLNTIPVC